MLFFIIPTLTFFAMGSPISLEFPVLKGFNFKGGVSLKPEYLALWLALSYYTACFIAEIVRGGILAIHKGQREAAYALGLTPNRTLQLAIIPQALPLIIPPLTSNYLNLDKELVAGGRYRLFRHRRHDRHNFADADRQRSRDDGYRAQHLSMSFAHYFRGDEPSELQTENQGALTC